MCEILASWRSGDASARVSKARLGARGAHHGAGGYFACGPNGARWTISMRTPSGVTTNAWSSRLLLPGSTRHARALPLRDSLRDVVHDEAHSS
jgi:hypothetical protein